MRLFLLIFFSVSWGFAQQIDPSSTEDIAKAMQEMQKAMQQLNQQSDSLNVIGFRDLKAILPTEILGKDLHNAEGERNATMGMKMSKASGEYGQRGDGAFVQIEFMDVGTLKGIMAMSMAGWSMMEVDRESDREMEQTFKYKGYKGIKEYNFENNEGEIKILVKGRVIVDIEVQDVPLKKFDSILDSIPLKKLESLVASAQEKENE